MALPNFMAARLRGNVTGRGANMKTVDTAIHICANDYGGATEPDCLCAKQNTYISTAWDCGDIGTVPGVGIYTGWVMIHFGNFVPREQHTWVPS